MSVEKSELKIAVIENLGSKADDRVEALTADFHRAEGAVKAFEEGAKKIETEVYAHFKRDIDEGKVPGDPNQAADKYIKTCLHLFMHMAKVGLAKLPLHQGRIQEATENVNRLKAEQNEERLKIQAVKAAESAGHAQLNDQGDLEMAPTDSRHPPRRPAGVRPGPTLKQQRSEPAPPVVPAVPVRKRKVKHAKDSR